MLLLNEFLCILEILRTYASVLLEGELTTSNQMNEYIHFGVYIESTAYAIIAFSVTIGQHYVTA